MYRFFRIIMLILVWLTILIIPFYLFISYLCYSGLCGGQAAIEIRNHPHYLSIIQYSIWLYPLIGFYSLFQSRKLSPRPFYSILILFLPWACLIPTGYVLYQVEYINTKYTQQETTYFSPHADDFVCSPGKFIRYHAAKRKYFSFFETTCTSRTVSFFYTNKELKEFLKLNNIDKSQCKNKKGLSLFIENVGNQQHNNNYLTTKSGSHE